MHEEFPILFPSDSHMVNLLTVKVICCRLQRYVVDFYISDFQTGLRALVKAGYGARVSSYVAETPILDVTLKNKDLSPEFVRWLTERNLSADDRVMRLKEG